MWSVLRLGDALPTMAGAAIDVKSVDVKSAIGIAVGVAVGVAIGVANLLASRWTSRAAVTQRGSHQAVGIMMGGFLIRLMLLAAIILGIPRTWMNHNAFVITFLLAFMIGIAIEARSFLRTKVEIEGSR